MHRIKSIGLIDLLSYRLASLSNSLKNGSARKKRLHLTCLLSVVIIITVFIVLFTCFPNFSDSEIGFDELNLECLKSHNYYRSLHGVPPLKLDHEIIKFAKERAKHLVFTDVFEHPKDLKDHGENLHFIMPARSYSCNKVVTPWYDEIKLYNYENPMLSRGQIGHFTQVVWKNTTKVGCAQAYSEVSQRLYTVCNYQKPGNYRNRYHQNVLPPINNSK